MKPRARWLAAVSLLVLLGGGTSLIAQPGGPFAAQIENFWAIISTGGRAFVTLAVQAGGYANWGAVLGTGGYGIRDNAGVMEVKNNAGVWTPFGAAGVFNTVCLDAANQDVCIERTAANTMAFYTGGVGGTARWRYDTAEITSTIPETLTAAAGNAFRIQMSTPAAPTMTQNQLGTDLAAGNYATALVALDPVSGVTLPTATQTVTVGAGGTGRIVFTFTFPTGSLTVRAYVSAMGGATPDRYFTCTASPCNVDTLTGATVAALPSAASAYQTNMGGATANWTALLWYLPAGSPSAPSITSAANPTLQGISFPAAYRTSIVSNGNTAIDFNYNGFALARDTYMGWSSSTTAPVAGSVDTFFTRETAAVIQLGADAAGVTNQMLKGPDRITTAGVGANVTIAGGRGWDTGVGGSLIFQTAPAAGAGVAGVLATALTIDSTKQATFAGGLSTGAGVISGADVGVGGVNYLYWIARTQVNSPANGQLNINNAAISSGIGLDVTTDSVVLFKNRAQNAAGGIGFASLAVSGTAPTIASGGCTSPAITSNNGTAKFKLTIGTTCAGIKTITLTMPAAANEWACDAVDLTTNATYRPEQSAAASATSVVITNYARTTGLAIDWADGEVLLVKCIGG